MTKLIFVSHASKDATIANIFKDDVERSFLGMCELFVSSNLDSLGGGQEWIGAIKKNLMACDILIGLVSPLAMQRPWVYFEFGAAWARGIPAIPICHSGLSRDQLPAPISVFQALELTDELHISHLYRQISKLIGCGVPSVSFETFASSYRMVTEVAVKNTFLSQMLGGLIKINPEFMKLILSELTEVEVLVPPELDREMMKFSELCGHEGLLTLTPEGFAIGTRIGAHASIYKAKRDVNTDKLRELLGLQNTP